MQARQYVRDFAHSNVQFGATAAQLLVQISQALLQEKVMLQGTVGLSPKAGLHHVQAQHGATLCGVN